MLSNIKLVIGYTQKNLLFKIYPLLRGLSFLLVSKKKHILKPFDIEKEKKHAISFLEKYGFTKLKPISKLTINNILDLDLKKIKRNSIIVPSSYAYHYDDLLRLAKANKSTIIDERGVLPKERYKTGTSNHKMDFGISDVFFPEFALSDIQIEEICQFSQKIDEFMYSLGKKRLDLINIYFYQNVFSPRCFHSDFMLDKYKVFLYLDDVEQFNQGPYAFLEKSHKGIFPLIQKLSRYIIKPFLGNDLGCGTWDAILYSHKSMTPIFAKKGEVVITHNRGIHGDFPCKENFNRRVLVLHYA